MPKTDREILRDLTKRYLEVACNPLQDERRELWRKKNSLEDVRPLIYVRAFAFSEMPEAECSLEDPFLRSYEALLRKRLFHAELNDDFIFEPWITVRAAYRCTGWGIRGERRYSTKDRGSWKYDYPLKKKEDINKLKMPVHEIDEKETEERKARLSDVIGDLISIDIDRAPVYRVWSGDISTDLGYLRGIEHFMVDMIEDPGWLHELLSFMRDGILATHRQAEFNGDWGLSAHENQAMPYSRKLKDPAPNVRGVDRSELWGYMAAQEFTAVSPAMHEEFLLNYQLPILREFGLAAYGCCEDLSAKIDMLRQIPNLRRIAVAPAADVARCAEQIGRDYVISYRPSPADMVGYGFDPERVKNILRRDLRACRDTHVDITLKDVETVQGDPERVAKWVGITRRIIDEIWS